MSQEETSVDGTSAPDGSETADAGDNAAAVAEGPSPAEETSEEAEATSEAGEGEAPDDDGAAEEPADSASAYKAALDSYLGGDLRKALEIVDAVLERDPETELKPRLERLRRRAEDRIAKEPPPEAEEEGEAEEEAEAEEEGEAEAEDEAEEEEAEAEEEGEAEAEEEGEAEAPVKPSGTKIQAPKADGSGEAEAVEEAPSSESARLEAASESGRAKRPPPSSDRVPAQKRRPPAAAGQQPVARRKRPRGGVVQRRTGASGSHKAVGAGGAAMKADLDRINNSVNRLANSFRVVEGSVVKVAEAYQRVAKANKRKEQAYDQLYEELRGYKDNFLLAAQKPLFKDIILLFDGVRRTMASLEGEEGDKVAKDKVLEGLKHIQEEVLEVLYRRDIELIEEHPDRLNIDFQKPVQRIETDNPEEDRQVVQIIREGFKMNGVLMRAQEVIVKRCVQEKQETE